MDFNDMQMWHYFAIAGGAVLLLGVIAYFLPVGKMKIPGVITAASGARGRSGHRRDPHGRFRIQAV